MIKVYSSRSVHPNIITISNQYENKTRYLDFDLSEVPEGNRYLIVTYEKTSYAFPIGEDGTFEVTSSLTWEPAKTYYANIVVSDIPIVDKLESSNALFVSDTMKLIVSKNYINAESLSEQPFPKELKIVYDDLLNLKKEIEQKLENGEFNGKDGVGIKSIEKTGSEGLVDTYTITFTDETTIQYTVRNGANGKDGEKGDPGEKGDTGLTPNIQIGTVTTLEPDQQATVERTGDNENPVFNFGIPKGEDGKSGEGSYTNSAYEFLYEKFKNICGSDVYSMNDGNKVYNFDISTFSGWCTNFKLKKGDFLKGIYCNIKARENGNKISKLRCRVAINNLSENDKVYDKYKAIDIPIGENKDIFIDDIYLYAIEDSLVWVVIEVDTPSTFMFRDVGSSEYYFDYNTNGDFTKTLDQYAERSSDGNRYPLWIQAEILNNSVILEDGSITAEKTDFIKRYYGENIFDKDNMAIAAHWAYFKDNAQGIGNEVEILQNQYTSGYYALEIPIPDNTNKISLKHGHVDGYKIDVYSYFMVDDKNICKSYEVAISDDNLENGYTIDVPNEATKVMLSVTYYKEVVIDGHKNLMVCVGDTPKDYVPYENYKYIIEGLKTTSKNEEDIKNIQQIVGEKGNVKLNVPESYNLVVGDTFELFFKGIINAVNTDMFYVVARCNKGNCFTRKYVYTPVEEDIGTLELNLELYSFNNNLIDSKVINLIINPKPTNPSEQKNILYVGDSLAVDGTVASEFNRRLTASDGTPKGNSLTNINFIGTCISASGVKFEGYGGWRFDDYNTENKKKGVMWIECAGHDKTQNDQHSKYKDSSGKQWKLETIEDGRIKIIGDNIDVSLPTTSGTLTWVSGGENHTEITYTNATEANGNPFWDEETMQVDFEKYAQRIGVSKIDYIYVLLGWNSAWDSMSAIKDKATTFINNVISKFPNCKIVLLGLQIPARDGLGENYSTDGMYSRYLDLIDYVYALDNTYNQLSKELANNVSSVNISGQFDTEYNMQTTEKSPNVRNNQKISQQSNGVHPAQSGYYQIADACYRDFVNKIKEA